MAEKRAKSRAVLLVTQLSLYGFGNEEDIVLPQKIKSKKDVNEALKNIFD